MCTTFCESFSTHPPKQFSVNVEKHFKTHVAGADPGGGGKGALAPPFSEPCPPPHFLKEIRSISRGGGAGLSLGIDFHSGFRIFFQVYTFIVASEEKKHKGGGVQFEILRNPGIDSYSGFRKIQVYTFIVASEKKNTRGGGVQFEILKKSRYRLL